MAVREHKFGIVIFVPMEVVLKGIELGQVAVARIPSTYDPEDPFCFNCGMKQINVRDPECPGRADPYSSNPRIYT